MSFFTASCLSERQPPPPCRGIPNRTDLRASYRGVVRDDHLDLCQHSNLYGLGRPSAKGLGTKRVFPKEGRMETMTVLDLEMSANSLAADLLLQQWRGVW